MSDNPQMDSSTSDREGYPWQPNPLDCAFAYPPLNIAADLKTQPADFLVEEVMGFEPSGEGEHCWLWIEKTNSNTDFIAKRLARIAGVSRRDVSYAGMKDRNAVTQQWFSVHLPGQPDPDWAHIESESLRVLHTCRHHKKLRRGMHRGNRFVIRLRQIQGEGDTQANVEARLKTIAEQGVPNYFGLQRFGHDGKNLDQAAERLFQGKKLPRHQRSISLSAMRSWLFNRVLSLRVEQGLWNQAVEGDVLMRAENRASFVWPEDLVEQQDCIRRVGEQELHPTATLPGVPSRHSLPASGDALCLEQRALIDCDVWIEGLQKLQLEMDCRATRLLVQDLQWQWADEQGQPTDDQLVISFQLQKGAFATMVFRELMRLHDRGWQSD